MEDKNSFAGRLPFSQRKSYLWWLRVSGVFIGLLGIILLGMSVKDYLVYQNLVAQKASLIGSVSHLDEIVSKKNKLLARYNQQGHYSKKNQTIHSTVAKFLIEIEDALVEGVYLSSFEFMPNKIELTGYSDSIEGLSETIFKLQNLPFVKDHDVDQVTKDIKALSYRLAFTITINL